MLTDVGPLGHAADVHLLAELRLVVVDVVEFDDELGLGFQFLARLFVHHCGSEDVERLFLAVQAASGLQIAVILVEDKDGAGAFARQDVQHVAVVLVLVGLELQDRHRAKFLSANGSWMAE